MGIDTRKASVLLDLDRPDQAEEELLRLLAESPGDPEAHRLLALARKDLGRLDEALDSAREAVRLAPDSDDAHSTLGLVLWSRVDLDEASRAFKEAIRLNPESAWLRALKASVHLDQNRAKWALNLAREGLEMAPGYAALHTLRGRALWILERRGKAEVAFRKALSLDPGDVDAQAGLGAVHFRRGDLEKAMSHFREALRLRPTHGAALSGVMDILKSRYPLYGRLLSYLDRRVAPQEGRVPFLIAAIVAIWAFSYTIRVVHRPGFGELLLFSGLVGVLIAWILMYAAEPVFDLALRVTREGRLMMTPGMKRASTAVGLCLLAVLCLGWVAMVTGSMRWVWSLTLVVAAIPAVRFFAGSPAAGPRAIALGVVALLVLSGVAAALLPEADGLRSLGTWYAIGGSALLGLFGLLVYMTGGFDP